MINGIALVNSNRVWYVPDVNVWGSTVWSELDMAMVEETENVMAVFYNTGNPGDNIQEIKYQDLTDYRGNKLPAQISNPRILVKQKSENTAYIAGVEGGESFRITREKSAPESVTVDLIIYEMGS